MTPINMHNKGFEVMLPKEKEQKQIFNYELLVVLFQREFRLSLNVKPCKGNE